MQERQFYIETFEKNGMAAPLKYYTSTEYRFEEEQGKTCAVLSPYYTRR